MGISRGTLHTLLEGNKEIGRSIQNVAAVADAATLRRMEAEKGTTSLYGGVWSEGAEAIPLSICHLRYGMMSVETGAGLHPVNRFCGSRGRDVLFLSGNGSTSGSPVGFVSIPAGGFRNDRIV